LKIATSRATGTSDRSPPDSNDKPLDLLAGRARFDLETGREHVVGVGEQQPPLAAGEQPREDPLELRGRVVERRHEGLLDPLVDLPDDVQQVALGGFEVFELGGEERVPLFERGILLQREGVDPPESGELALGRPQPLLLGLPDEGGRLGQRVGVGVGVVGVGDDRDELVRAELLDEHLGVDAVVPPSRAP
jgi:hypothetical protein